MKPLLIPIPRWGRRPCEGADQEIFFTDANDRTNVPSDEALALCNQCDIRVKCLEWAMDHDEVGVWGGTTYTQRRKLKRKGVQRVHCIGCGSVEVFQEERIEVCLACGLSWII